MLGKTLGSQEISDEAIVSNLVKLSESVALHLSLARMMHEASSSMDTPLSELISILKTAKISELPSLGKIVQVRLGVINRLDCLKGLGGINEGDLQRLIEDGPTLVNPEWSPIISNQPLSTLGRGLEQVFEREAKVSLNLTEFNDPIKRPDFVLVSHNCIVQMVEIKRPAHALNNSKMERIERYINCMEAYLLDEINADLRVVFRGFHMTLVCDRMNLSSICRRAFRGLKLDGLLTHINWVTFLLRTRRMHSEFLAESRRQRTAVARQGLP